MVHLGVLDLWFSLIGDLCPCFHPHTHLAKKCTSGGHFPCRFRFSSLIYKTRLDIIYRSKMDRYFFNLMKMKWIEKREKKILTNVESERQLLEMNKQVFNWSKTALDAKDATHRHVFPVRLSCCWFHICSSK